MNVTDTLLVVRVLDQLLVVLMLVQILHTVRISIRSHTLVTEPFLVVEPIASLRRILVITLEAATLTTDGKWTADGSSILHDRAWPARGACVGVFHHPVAALG